LRDLGIDVITRSHRAPPIAAAAQPFRYSQPDGLQRCQIGIELIDLEGARQSAQNSGMHRQISDVGSLEENLAAIWLEHACQQIDDRGLPGAIGPDQGVAGALLDAE